MVLVYATTSDLAASPWGLTDPPANVARLLAHASGLVRTATLTAVYDVDAERLPTDTTVAEGFRDAVCAQVSTWVEAGIDPAQAGGGNPGVVASKSLGPRSVQYAVYERDASQRRYITTHLTDEAAGYLWDLDIWPGVQVIG
ncbi:hypothetical protein GCM10027059_26580 [Myceligenerans halotolerans]